MNRNFKSIPSWKNKLHEVIFEADTFKGKLFDIILLTAILLSVIAVMLETVPAIFIQYGEELYIIEWIFTILFTIEYAARIIAVTKPRKYIFSFYGIIDLMAILPLYISFFIVGTQSLMVIRAIRLLRIFRVLKLGRFIGEATHLSNALKASRAKILVFVFAVFTMVIIMGTVMYLIEGAESGFTSIPKSVYWAVVTLTTVGYGDIVPQTTLGQALSTLLMITGYGIIAVPTGIVGAEMTNPKNFPSGKISTQACPHCSAEGHDIDAVFCKKCGGHL